MTPTEATEIVTILSNGWESPSVSHETQALWSDLIEDLDAPTARAAALRLVQVSRTRPPISELRKLVAAELSAAESGAPQFIETEEAWGVVQRSFGTIGRYGPFPDAHPLVAEAVARLGWVEMCASTNLEATRAHFLRVYAQVLDRARQDSAATHGARPQLPDGSGVSRIESASARLVAIEGGRGAGRRRRSERDSQPDPIGDAVKSLFSELEQAAAPIEGRKVGE